MLPILIYILLGLFMMYLVGRYIPPLGDAIAFGAILLEMVGGIPINERLFPPLHKVLRVFFALYALVGLVLSIVVIYYFFQFRAIYIDPTLRKNLLPLDLSNISLIIFGGLGL